MALENLSPAAASDGSFKFVRGRTHWQAAASGNSVTVGGGRCQASESRPDSESRRTHWLAVGNFKLKLTGSHGGQPQTTSAVAAPQARPRAYQAWSYRTVWRIIMNAQAVKLLRDWPSDGHGPAVTVSGPGTGTQRDRRPGPRPERGVGAGTP